MDVFKQSTLTPAEPLILNHLSLIYNFRKMPSDDTIKILFRLLQSGILIAVMLLTGLIAAAISTMSKLEGPLLTYDHIDPYLIILISERTAVDNRLARFG